MSAPVPLEAAHSVRYMLDNGVSLPEPVRELVEFVERFAPRDLPTLTAEGPLMAGEQSEIRLNDPRLDGLVDLIRLNGRVYVPEPVTIEDTEPDLVDALEGAVRIADVGGFLRVDFDTPDGARSLFRILYEANKARILSEREAEALSPPPPVVTAIEGSSRSSEARADQAATDKRFSPETVVHLAGNGSKLTIGDVEGYAKRLEQVDKECGGEDAILEAAQLIRFLAWVAVEQERELGVLDLDPGLVGGNPAG